jgi:serine/threonine protein kinase
MITLKSDEDIKIEVPQYKVLTFGRAVAKEPGEIRLKAIMSPDQYIFRKQGFAAGGCASLYVGIDPKTDHLVAIKAVAVKHKKARRLEPKDVAFRTSCAARELLLSDMADRSYGPVRALANTKASRIYLVQGLLSGTAKEAISEMSRFAPRFPVTLTVAQMAFNDYAKLFKDNILHFDLHIENICYSKSEKSVEIIDFGLSCMGDAALPAGSSNEYSSPRHQRELICNARDDIFSLGVTFAEYALGRPVFGQITRPKQAPQPDQMHAPVTRHFKLEPSDLTNANRDRLSKEQLDYEDAFKRELLRFSPSFGQLCLDMMETEKCADLDVSTVSYRLNKMSAEITPEDKVSVAEAWDYLPNYSPPIQNHIDALRADIERVKNGILKVVR